MAHNNYSLKYRTFNQLFEDVSVDFRSYSLEGLIEPQTLIKIARKCNYDLGFRIYRTRQIMLEVERGKVRLPDDFHIMNFAVVAGEHTVTEALPQGTNIEERLVAPDFVCQPSIIDTCAPEPDPCDPVDPCDNLDPCTGTCITKCGKEFQLIQKINTTTRTFRMQFPLRINDNERIQNDLCIDGVKVPPHGTLHNGHLHHNTLITGITPLGTGPIDEARIEDGFLVTNFECGTVYVNYMGDMIDDQGNVMVPDHEFLNEYYEYALKKRILENLVMNGENVGERYNIIAAEFRAARNNALSIVNTPNFGEMQKLWQANRKAQYHRYYNMFKSYWPLSYKRFGYQR